MDSTFEEIAVYRTSGTGWGPVLAWIAECGVTDPHGNRVTAETLAATWHRVKTAREARGLHKPPVFSAGVDRQESQQGSPEMASAKIVTPVSVRFSGDFAEALAEADRHSPLFLFLRDNYDTIFAHRPKQGGWHKFLAVLNAAGLRDGQGNAVTPRILKRTWYKVNKTVLADRSRPAACIGTSPLQRSDKPRPSYSEDPDQTGSPTILSPHRPADRHSSGASHPNPQIVPRSPTGTPDKSATPLTLEQAWMIQNLRNKYRKSAGFSPATELDHDLVKRLVEQVVPTCTEAV
ncbi:MAG: hypothetical protein PHT60_15070 [Acidiphilium sp.]|nr:hypothetical protein [Acidiphilium sp.]